MVGLVIVSHSRELANALLHLVKQVTSSNIPIAVAAGVGNNRAEFGTDAVEISEAISAIFSEDGVIVMMDLGSAVLSAQMASELLPPEISERIRFCAAPLVEGCIAAAVQIGLGSDMETVCREAKQALLPKQEQIGDLNESNQQLQIAEHGKQIVLTLHNLHGLHARPAARFVQTAAKFNAEVTVANLTNGKGPVSARSLNSIATLGAIEEHQIRISASGTEADAALDALKTLADDNFGESAAPQTAQPTPSISPAETLPATDGALKAVAISDGIAIGPLYRYQPQLAPISQEPAQNVEQEWKRLEQAIAATSQAIRLRHQTLKATIGEAEASIFEAHLLILQDPDLSAQAHRAIYEHHQNAAIAWNETIAHTAASYRALDDPYLQQRAVDVEDVGSQVLFALAGKAAASAVVLTEPAILFAQDITPTETAQLDMTKILGIITIGGGPTSHSAILARALGIPAVSSASPSLEHLPLGTPLALDGFGGKVWVTPPPAIQAELQARRSAWLESRQKLLQTSHAAAQTQDGHHIEVFANIGNVQDAQNAVKNGADGIGLLRTEFLFLTRETPPSESEQLTVLRQIGAVMGDRPVTVRTLDVGGDKEVPYIQLPPESNPFLGVRAIRMSLRNEALFITQLRAILRAADDFQFRIMFPMIANVDEVRQARALLAKAHQQLTEENLPHAWPIETGIMVEIPSAALLSNILAREVDFFSIGTNDLTQYTLAAERGNPLLADMADALHPAILQLVAQVVKSAHAEGKWVGVCGELAGSPLAAPILVGLGVDELSLNPGGIPLTKSIIRAVDSVKVGLLAKQALETESVSEIRKLAQSFLNEGQTANA